MLARRDAGQHMTGVAASTCQKEIRMPIDAIVGACWGDEGKGKLTDFLAGEADFVVRYQGGRNAGHTIVNDFGRFALHLLPSGVFTPQVVNVLAPGVALDMGGLLEELDALAARGVPTPRLRISDRCQVVLPTHVLFDRAEEGRLAERRFGSTQMGIAPFYADKALKLGVQIADLSDEARLHERLEASLVTKNVLLQHLYGQAPVRAESLMPELMAHADRLRPHICDTTSLLHEALGAGRRVLVEGQLGALRDPDHGVYPFSTSSSPLAGHACVGAGLPPRAFERIIAVAKAYSTCVGATPFVGELDGAPADALRERGNEYGATTGRPRRVAWLDAVATRYGCRVQGATEVALTLLDVLGHLERVPICVEYEIDGERTRDFPPTTRLERAKPIYEYWPGWQCDVSNARHPSDLPSAARRYVERVEELLDTPLGWVSVGPEREATIRYSS
jgi:adenylosuccinate synthase